MPIKIDVRIVKDEIQPIMKSLLQRLGNLTPLMKNVGELASRSIGKTFEQEGRPKKWKPLAKSTIKQRTLAGHWPGKILQRHGFLKQMVYKAESRRVLVFPRGESSKYAAIQHFGGQAGRGHKVTIPARPFMLIQQEDWAEIKKLAEAYLMEISG